MREQKQRRTVLLSRLGKVKERLNISRVNHPKYFVFLMLAIINVGFFIIAAFVIQRLLSSTAGSTRFGVCLYYAVTMVLDAGCIANVVKNIGTAGTALVIACVIIVIFGMITFTGAVIGYITTIISGIIDNTNSGNWRLHISGHTVLLNWNSRASEIINDLLYSDQHETVVVLSNRSPDEIREEIEERLYDTINSENQALRDELRGMPFLKALWRYRRDRLSHRHVTVIVREGDTYSLKLLSDISLNQAKAVVILGADRQHDVCRYKNREISSALEQGNSNLLKTTIQVTDITAASVSAENQQIVVEVEDKWTRLLIDRVIAHKKNIGKNNIVPISADRILGQLLSQFSIMPELSDIYGELFSNKGAAFYSRNIRDVRDAAEGYRADETGGERFIPAFLQDHVQAIPLTCMVDNEGNDVMYFMADSDQNVDEVKHALSIEPVQLALNPRFSFTRRNVIILGHNSKCSAIMDGFNSFRNEWNYHDSHGKDRGEVLNITVIDDAETLERLHNYQDYPYVERVVPASIYDRERILDTIRDIVRENVGNTSILILSDDNVASEDIDSAALTYLIYVQEAISAFTEDNSVGVDPSKIDVIVEIQNPKNHDVVRSYNASNIVISNRFISKMVTQISEKKTIFDFFSDILIYDDGEDGSYKSMELYVKPVRDFFARIPGPCTAAQLIRSVYAAGPRENKSVILGYVPYDAPRKRSGRPVLFSGNQMDAQVSLSPQDKVILFSNH